MGVSSRQDLADYCLRNLGAPVIKINVADEQLSDRIDEAFEYFQQFHYDATEQVLLKYQVQQTDINSQSITLDDTIMGVKRVYPPTDNFSTNNLFDFRYQLRQNELWQLSSISYVPYVLTMQHIEMLNILFVGEPPIRFSRHTNKINVDYDWVSKVNVGDYFLVEATKIIDPEVHTSVYNDPMLKELTTAMIQRQWGGNMMKFGGLELPGGVILNGRDIYLEALEKISSLKKEIRDTYERPPMLLVF